MRMIRVEKKNIKINCEVFDCGNCHKRSIWACKIFPEVGTLRFSQEGGCCRCQECLDSEVKDK